MLPTVKSWQHFTNHQPAPKQPPPKSAEPEKPRSKYVLILLYGVPMVYLPNQNLDLVLCHAFRQSVCRFLAQHDAYQL